MAEIYRGHVFHIGGSPADVEHARESLVSIPDGALVVSDGLISWVGRFDELPAQYEAHPVTHRAEFILPGFVDTHLHYPQTFATVAYGGGELLEWLERCIFPAEAQLADVDHSALVAAEFNRRRIANGTTAAMVFGSAFPTAQDALFKSTEVSGLRVVSGRGIQTTGPPSAHPLMTSEATAVQLVVDEIAAWHAIDTGDASTARLQVAVVPRFSLSVTASTLAALGELYEHHRGEGVYFHSHLNENNRPGDGEIAMVKSAFGVDCYLDTYDGKFLPGSRRGGDSLLGRRSSFAHGVHCSDDELARLAETGSSIAHCPTSQQFLGSGTMPWRRTMASGVNVSMGSDVGAGDHWSIAQVLNDCYKVHLSEAGADSIALHPAEMLFLGTLAGARTLDMEPQFGNLDPGKDADFLLVDSAQSRQLAHALRFANRAEDAEQARDRVLFALLMALNEHAITGVFVKGRAAVAST